jgi:hypothetical protein
LSFKLFDLHKRRSVAQMHDMAECPPAFLARFKQKQAIRRVNMKTVVDRQSAFS